LEENGHFVAIATGRLQVDAFSYARSLGLNNLVADGGNSVTLNGVVVLMESLPVPEVADLLERLDARKIPWALSIDNSLTRYAPDERFGQSVVDGYMETRVDPDMNCRNMEHIYKAHIACGSQEERNVDWGGLPTVRFTEACMFIEPDDKSRGIRVLMKLLNAPCEDVVVFGDGLNDLKMFLPDWYSIAMGNAVPALKEQADFVTRSSDEDGILFACRHFGWVD
jgi:hydroxymethylpyrimidine pyrophosphatase-like HAD family hydrolase